MTFVIEAGGRLLPVEVKGAMRPRLGTLAEVAINRRYRHRSDFRSGNM